MLTTDSYKGTNKKRTVQQLVRKNFWLQLSNSRCGDKHSGLGTENA